MTKDFTDTCLAFNCSNIADLYSTIDCSASHEHDSLILASPYSNPTVKIEVYLCKYIARTGNYQ